MIYTNGKEFRTYARWMRESNDYYLPDARELYDWIESETDKYDQWDAVPWEAYDQLADACGVDMDKCEDTQDLMNKCYKVIEEEEK